MDSRQDAYQPLLEESLKKRGLNKENIYQLLLYYTNVIINTEGLTYSDGETLTTDQKKDLVTAFIDRNPLTIDTILRYK